MIDLIKKIYYKKILKKKYGLSNEETNIFINAIHSIGYKDSYKSWLQRDYFQQLYTILFEQHPEYFQRIKPILIQIDKKLFQPEEKPPLFENTSQIPVNYSIEITDYINKIKAQGTIFNQSNNHISILIEPPERKPFSSNSEVLLRTRIPDRGSFECLSIINKISNKPLYTISVKHEEFIHQEKRKYIRYPTNLTTSIISWERNPPQIIRLPASVSDISLGGLQFFSNYLIESGAKVQIELPLDETTLNYEIQILKRKFDLEKKIYYYRTFFLFQQESEQINLEGIIQQIREK